MEICGSTSGDVVTKVIYLIEVGLVPRSLSPGRENRIVRPSSHLKCHRKPSRLKICLILCLQTGYFVCLLMLPHGVMISLDCAHRKVAFDDGYNTRM